MVAVTLLFFGAAFIVAGFLFEPNKGRYAVHHDAALLPILSLVLGGALFVAGGAVLSWGMMSARNPIVTMLIGLTLCIGSVTWLNVQTSDGSSPERTDEQRYRALLTIWGTVYLLMVGLALLVAGFVLAMGSDYDTMTTTFGLVAAGSLLVVSVLVSEFMPTSPKFKPYPQENRLKGWMVGLLTPTAVVFWVITFARWLVH